jgi:Uma2 family endonuclease
LSTAGELLLAFLCIGRNLEGVTDTLTHPLESWIPPDGWSTDDLDALPVSHVRYELTDGALTVSPTPSSQHQSVAGLLLAHLHHTAPVPYAVTQAVEIRFTKQLTRIPDVLVVRSEEPTRHWFSPSEVVVAVEIESPGSHTEDRITKPGLYARFEIPHYWRIELTPELVARQYRAEGGKYRHVAGGPRLTTEEPFPVDLALADVLPSWAR